MLRSVRRFLLVIGARVKLPPHVVLARPRHALKPKRNKVHETQLSPTQARMQPKLAKVNKVLRVAGLLKFFRDQLCLGNSVTWPVSQGSRRPGFTLRIAPFSAAPARRARDSAGRAPRAARGRCARRASRSRSPRRCSNSCGAATTAHAPSPGRLSQFRGRNSSIGSVGFFFRL